MDTILERLTPGPTIPLAVEVVAARAAVLAAAADLLAVPDGVLDRPWTWRGEEADVRYGLYEPYERLEVAAGDARRALEASGVRATPSVARFAAATVARWDLHGLLAGLDEATFDADPGDGEDDPPDARPHRYGQRTYACSPAAARQGRRRAVSSGCPTSWRRRCLTSTA
jgi:hypothetical protein